MEHPSKILNRLGLRPRRSLGQNFLADGNVVEKILSLCRPDGKDVLEIGPGLGALTLPISNVCRRLVAVELDRRLCEYLESILPKDRVRLIRGDFLTVSDDELFRSFGGRGKALLVGNLPYSVSGPILFRILSMRERIERCCLMLQKEVAERLAAGPGGKEYGVLSVLYGAVGFVTVAFHVKRNCFYPVPEVDSSVVDVRFDAAREGDVVDFGLLASLVEAAFGKRRKMLRNALKDFFRRFGVSSDGMEDLLRAAGVDPSDRAEHVPVDGYVALSRLLFENRLDNDRGSN